MNTLRTLLVMLALAALLQPAVASPGEAIQPLESIAAAARQQLEALARRNWGDDRAAQVEITVQRLDPRLRLPACRAPLAAEMPAAGRPLGSVAVNVRCADPAWSLFVPGRVSVQRPVVVMAASRPRGALLSESDLAMEHRDLGALPAGYVTDPAELVGKELRRPVQARAVVLPGMARAPELVRRGERVTLQAAAGGIAVHSEGEALNAGALGERVRVRNLSTRRVVEGTVGGDGLVLLALPGGGMVR